MNLAAWFLYATAIGLLLILAAGLLEPLILARRWPVRPLWAAALLLLLTLPLASPLRSKPPPGEPISVFLPVADATASPVAVAPRATPAPIAPPPAPRPLSLSGNQWLIAGWAFLSAALTASLSAAYLGFRRRRRGWRPAEVDGRRVWIARDVGPAALGVLRGRIVLPEWVLEASPAERQLILAHEEEHLRASDPRLLAAVLLIALALPWNPAVWISWRAIRRAVEIDCDRRVLRRGFDPRRYGRLLLEVTERGTPHRFTVAAPAESRSFLERRIRLMISQPRSLLRPRAAAALVLAIAAVSAAFRLQHPSQNPEPRTGFALVPAGAMRLVAAPEQPPAEEPPPQRRDPGPSTPENEARLLREMLRSILEREHPEILQRGPGGAPVTLYVLIDGNGDLVRSAVSIERRGRECMQNVATVLGVDMLPSDFDFGACGYAAAGEAAPEPVSYQVAALKPESEQQRIAPTGPYPIGYIFHRGRPSSATLTALIRQHHPDVYQAGLPEGETLWAVGNDANEIVRSGRQWGWAGRGAARDAIRRMLPDLHIGDVRETSVTSASGQRIPVVWMRILPPQMSIASEGKEPYPQARTFGVSSADPGRIVEFHLAGPGAEDLGRFHFSRGSRIIDGVLTATTPFTLTVLDDQPFQATLRLQGPGAMTIETEGNGVRVRQQLGVIQLRRGSAGEEITMMRGENARRLMVDLDIPHTAMVDR